MIIIISAVITLYEQEKMLGCSYPNAPFLITLESQGY